jgi:hypothetical protein
MGSGHLAMILREHDVTPDAVRSKLPAAIDTSQRLISAVQFSEEVIALLRAAFELGHLDPLNQITSENVLRALLVRDTAYSVVDLLQELSVDLDRLQMRLGINDELMDRIPLNKQALVIEETIGSFDYQRCSRQSLLSSECFFDNEAAEIVEDAWFFSQIVNRQPAQHRDQRQTTKSPHHHKHSELGIHHLLVAFRKLCPQSEDVRKIVAIIGDKRLTEMVINASLDELIELRNDANDVLLFSRLVADRTTDGLITPLMLLYGMVNQFDSILFMNSDLERLGRVAQQIRWELAAILKAENKFSELDSAAIAVKAEMNNLTAECSSTIGLVEDLEGNPNHIEPTSENRETPVRKTVEECLSRRSKIVYEHAILESKNFGHSEILVETIFLGLLYETFGPTCDVFSLLDLNLRDSRKILSPICRRRSSRTVAFRTLPVLSVNALRLTERAWEFSQLMKVNEIEPEHVVLAIADEEHGVASLLCEALALTGGLLRAEIIEAMGKSKKCGVPT